MKKMVMKKKGNTLTDNLFPLILGILVVVVIGYFVFQASEAGEDIIDAIPDAVATQAQTCKSVYAPIENTAGWCNPSKINDNEYMNCKYIKDNYDSTLGEDFEPACVGNEKIFCQQLKNEQGVKYATGKDYDPVKIFVNGVTCDSLVKP